MLASEFPGLKIFSTLSPLPLFSRWLKRTLDEGRGELFSESERKALGPLQSGLSDGETLRALLYEPGWEKTTEISEMLEAPLL